MISSVAVSELGWVARTTSKSEAVTNSPQCATTW